MDQDEMLLFKEGGVFLEFHRWLKPSFTHGFFVNPEEEFVFSDEIDVARRATGGGIIYHGKDLSFALCFPDTHPFAHEDTMQVYDTLNRLMEQAILEVHSCAIGTESEGTFSFKEPFCMAKAMARAPCTGRNSPDNDNSPANSKPVSCSELAARYTTVQ
jgi:lipoate-protein ligase A